MNPDDLLQQINNKKSELSHKNGEYKTLLTDRATAQQLYSTEYAKKVLSLKSDGLPATLIPKLAEGEKYVAELKFNLDVAEAMVKACLQSMKNIHGVLDGIRSQLAWMKSEKGQG